MPEHDRGAWDAAVDKVRRGLERGEIDAPDYSDEDKAMLRELADARAAAKSAALENAHVIRTDEEAWALEDGMTEARQQGEQAARERLDMQNEREERAERKAARDAAWRKEQAATKALNDFREARYGKGMEGLYRQNREVDALLSGIASEMPTAAQEGADAPPPKPIVVPDTMEGLQQDAARDNERRSVLMLAAKYGGERGEDARKALEYLNARDAARSEKAQAIKQAAENERLGTPAVSEQLPIPEWTTEVYDQKLAEQNARVANYQANTAIYKQFAGQYALLVQAYNADNSDISDEVMMANFQKLDAMGKALEAQYEPIARADAELSRYHDGLEIQYAEDDAKWQADDAKWQADEAAYKEQWAQYEGKAGEWDANVAGMGLNQSAYMGEFDPTQAGALEAEDNRALDSLHAYQMQDYNRQMGDYNRALAEWDADVEGMGLNQSAYMGEIDPTQVGALEAEDDRALDALQAYQEQDYKQKIAKWEQDAKEWDASVASLGGAQDAYLGEMDVTQAGAFEKEDDRALDAIFDYEEQNFNRRMDEYNAAVAEGRGIDGNGAGAVIAGLTAVAAMQATPQAGGGGQSSGYGGGRGGASHLIGSEGGGASGGGLTNTLLTAGATALALGSAYNQNFPDMDELEGGGGFNVSGAAEGAAGLVSSLGGPPQSTIAQAGFAAAMNMDADNDGDVSRAERVAALNKWQRNRSALAEAGWYEPQHEVNEEIDLGAPRPTTLLDRFGGAASNITGPPQSTIAQMGFAAGANMGDDGVVSGSEQVDAMNEWQRNSNALAGAGFYEPLHEVNEEIDLGAARAPTPMDRLGNAASQIADPIANAADDVAALGGRMWQGAANRMDELYSSDDPLAGGATGYPSPIDQIADAASPVTGAIANAAGDVIATGSRMGQGAANRLNELYPSDDPYEGEFMDLGETSRTPLTQRALDAARTMGDYLKAGAYVADVVGEQHITASQDTGGNIVDGYGAVVSGQGPAARDAALAAVGGGLETAYGLTFGGEGAGAIAGGAYNMGRAAAGAVGRHIEERSDWDTGVAWDAPDNQQRLTPAAQDRLDALSQFGGEGDYASETGGMDLGDRQEVPLTERGRQAASLVGQVLQEGYTTGSNIARAVGANVLDDATGMVNSIGVPPQSTIAEIGFAAAMNMDADNDGELSRSEQVAAMNEWQRNSNALAEAGWHEPLHEVNEEIDLGAARPPTPLDRLGNAASSVTGAIDNAVDDIAATGSRMWQGAANRLNELYAPDGGYEGEFTELGTAASPPSGDMNGLSANPMAAPGMLLAGATAEAARRAPGAASAAWDRLYEAAEDQSQKTLHIPEAGVPFEHMHRIGVAAARDATTIGENALAAARAATSPPPGVDLNSGWGQPINDPQARENALAQFGGEGDYANEMGGMDLGSSPIEERRADIADVNEMVDMGEASEPYGSAANAVSDVNEAQSMADEAEWSGEAIAQAIDDEMGDRYAAAYEGEFDVTAHELAGRATEEEIEEMNLTPGGMAAADAGRLVRANMDWAQGGGIERMMQTWLDEQQEENLQGALARQSDIRQGEGMNWEGGVNPGAVRERAGMGDMNEFQSGAADDLYEGGGKWVMQDGELVYEEGSGDVGAVSERYTPAQTRVAGVARGTISPEMLGRETAGAWQIAANKSFDDMDKAAAAINARVWAASNVAAPHQWDGQGATSEQMVNMTEPWQNQIVAPHSPAAQEQWEQFIQEGAKDWQERMRERKLHGDYYNDKAAAQQSFMSMVTDLVKEVPTLGQAQTETLDPHHFIDAAIRAGVLTPEQVAAGENLTDEQKAKVFEVGRRDFYDHQQGAVGTIADVLPLIGTAKNWDDMSKGERALSLAFDAASIIPAFRAAAYVGKSGGSPYQIARTFTDAAGYTPSANINWSPRTHAASLGAAFKVFADPNAIPHTAVGQRNNTQKWGMREITGMEDLDVLAIPENNPELRERVAQLNRFGKDDLESGAIVLGDQLSGASSIELVDVRLKDGRLIKNVPIEKVLQENMAGEHISIDKASTPYGRFMLENHPEKSKMVHATPNAKVMMEGDLTPDYAKIQGQKGKDGEEGKGELYGAFGEVAFDFMRASASKAHPDSLYPNNMGAIAIPEVNVYGGGLFGDVGTPFDTAGAKRNIAKHQAGLGGAAERTALFTDGFKPSGKTYPAGKGLEHEGIVGPYVLLPSGNTDLYTPTPETGHTDVRAFLDHHGDFGANVSELESGMERASYYLDVDLSPADKLRLKTQGLTAAAGALRGGKHLDNWQMDMSAETQMLIDDAKQGSNPMIGEITPEAWARLSPELQKRLAQPSVFVDETTGRGTLLGGSYFGRTPGGGQPDPQLALPAADPQLALPAADPIKALPAADPVKALPSPAAPYALPAPVGSPHDAWNAPPSGSSDFDYGATNQSGGAPSAGFDGGGTANMSSPPPAQNALPAPPELPALPAPVGSPHGAWNAPPSGSSDFDYGATNQSGGAPSAGFDGGGTANMSSPPPAQNALSAPPELRALPAPVGAPQDHFNAPDISAPQPNRGGDFGGGAQRDPDAAPSSQSDAQTASDKDVDFLLSQREAEIQARQDDIRRAQADMQGVQRPGFQSERNTLYDQPDEPSRRPATQEFDDPTRAYRPIEDDPNRRQSVVPSRRNPYRAPDEPAPTRRDVRKGRDGRSARIVAPSPRPVRPTLGERPTRPTRPTLGERPTRPTRPERAERAERPTRPTRPERLERPTRPTRPERPERAERPARPTRPERPDRAERPTRPTRPLRPDRAERPTRPDRPTRPPRIESPTRPPRVDRPTSPDRPTRPTRPTRGPRPSRPDRIPPPTRPTRPTRPTPPDRPTRPTRIPPPTPPPPTRPKPPRPKGEDLEDASGALGKDYPRVVRWTQGSVEVTKDLVTGKTKISTAAHPNFGRPADTFKIIATSKEAPERQRIEMGEVDVVISPDGIKYVRDSEHGIRNKKVRQRANPRNKGESRVRVPNTKRERTRQFGRAVTGNF